MSKELKEKLFLMGENARKASQTLTLANSKIKNNALEAMAADIETNKLVKISEFLSPIYFPKKPEIIDAINGRNKIEISIFSLSIDLFLQL